MQRPFPNGHKRPFECNGYVTAVAVGQSQRLYSGVGMFTRYYLSSLPQKLRVRGVQLELNSVIFDRFTSETAIWIRKWLKMSVETSRKPQLEQFFKARAMGVVIEICAKCPKGRT